jgi:uncharacterized membrane protein YqjE
MTSRGKQESPLEVANPQRVFYSENSQGDGLLGESVAEESTVENGSKSNSNSSWMSDVEQTIALGEQFVGVIGGIADLARIEAALAVRTAPKVLMLWLLMMPIILLTWCAFSALVAWSAYVLTAEVGLGLLAFFLLQVLLLLTCRWWYAKYRRYMTLPYTRARIENFMRSVRHEFTGRDKAKE